MGRLSGFWKGVLWVKSSIIVGLIGGMLAYENHDEVKQIEYNIFDKKQPIENNYFIDPPGLNVEWRPNGQGKVETFLQYKSNSKVLKEIEIMEDMLPSNTNLVKGMQKRFDLDGVLFNIKDNDLYLTFNDSSRTYTRKIDRTLFDEQKAGYQKVQLPFDSLMNLIEKYLGGSQNGNN